MTHQPWCGAPRGYLCICPATNEEPCDRCRGWATVSDPLTSKVLTCPDCGGTGRDAPVAR